MGYNYLGEIANDVGSLPIHFSQDVEHERLHIEVQGFVIQEELGQEAEVLAVNLVVSPVHFIHRDVVLPIDLLSRRLPPLTQTLDQRKTKPCVKWNLKYLIYTFPPECNNMLLLCADVRCEM